MRKTGVNSGVAFCCNMTTPHCPPSIYMWELHNCTTIYVFYCCCCYRGRRGLLSEEGRLRLQVSLCGLCFPFVFVANTDVYTTPTHNRRRKSEIREICQTTTAPNANRTETHSLTHTDSQTQLQTTTLRILRLAHRINTPQTRSKPLAHYVREFFRYQSVANTPTHTYELTCVYI